MIKNASREFIVSRASLFTQSMIATAWSFMSFPSFLAMFLKPFGVNPNTGSIIGLVIVCITESIMCGLINFGKMKLGTLKLYRNMCIAMTLGNVLTLLIFGPVLKLIGHFLRIHGIIS